MSRARPSVVVVIALLGLVATAPAAVHAQDARPGAVASAANGRLLDVPYLPQTPDLCGGAAVAMVMRYWGARQVFAEDFAPLVDRSASGIRTSVLTAEVARRGWRSLASAGDRRESEAWLGEQLALGRPVIALIAVAPDRYHYVVVVARTSDRVIAHDPARAPFQLLSREAFDAAWAAAGRWALVVLPETSSIAAAAESSVTPDTRSMPETPAVPVHRPLPATACDAFVQAMVAPAASGDLTAAGAGLEQATRLCPDAASAWRELAGVRFLQSRWADASALGAVAARLDPDDRPGWELLATSRYLDDQPEAALRAWNQLDQPLIDVVRIIGADRTRHPVVTGLLRLPPRGVLTPGDFTRARRRLDELPSAWLSRLRYQPLDNGLADIDAVIVERPVLPRGVVPLTAAALRAVVQREARVESASPTGSGELWTLAWRWWEARPRVGGALTVPSPGVVPGVVTVDASWERQTYAIGPSGASTAARQQVNERRRAGLRVADWATSRVRWDAGLGFERWSNHRHAALDGALDARLAGDRLSVRIDAAAWLTPGSGPGFGSGGLSTAWRSTTEGNGRAWLAAAGWRAVTAEAPLDLWPGAGEGQARAPLLRAHPLLADGVIAGEVFGRQLSHATGEVQQPVRTAAIGVLRLAAFIDTARAWHTAASGATSRWHTDAGVGLRLALPGRAGTARIDVARGLRDGATAWSAGWQTPWPGR